MMPFIGHSRTAQLICSEKNQKSGVQVGIDWEGVQRKFLGDGKWSGSAYTGVCICQNSQIVIFRREFHCL